MQNQDADQQITAKKHRLQLEFLTKEGEYRKNGRMMIQLEMQIKQNKKKMDLLKMELEKSKIEAAKVALVQSTLEKEIKKLKRDIAGTK